MYKFTKENVGGIYDEIDRRISILIANGDLAESEIRGERAAMLQGVYSTLMVLAQNWPDVRYYCDCEEADRYVG